MQGNPRRRVVTRNGVVAGSVWETRMRMDEVKGGIKVFNGDDGREDDSNGDEEGGVRASRKLRRNQSDGVVAAEKRKRRSWKPPEPGSANGPSEKSPAQLRKTRSELSNSPRSSKPNCGELGGGKAGGTVSSNAGGVAGQKGVLMICNSPEDGGAVAVEEEEAAVEIEVARKSFDDKEIDMPAEKDQNVDNEKRINPIHEILISPELDKKQDPVMDPRNMHPVLVTPPPPRFSCASVEVEEEEIYESTSETHDRMQRIVDLVMWRDISKSAFVFGFGTFFLLSSSYAKDLNFSPLSAICYLGLVYLAIIFLYKSILRRGMDYDEMDGRCIVGEQEAIWVLRLLLPYLNEVLLKIRALFSGDPATTMKLAVLLFVMARCGSSITLWTLAKLVFFGLFTIPRFCSSYSTHLTRYGKFWVERVKDGWESCTHKKAVAAAIFTLMWNLSSNVARVWSVFMLVVAMKYYQQRMAEKMSGEQVEVVEASEEREEEESKPVQGLGLGLGPGPGLGPRRHRQRIGPGSKEMGSVRKLKKGL